MAFEGHGTDSWSGRSPGGFEFGVQGWNWGQPVPKSITFFLDNTAMVCDQYGRQIRRAVLSSGQEVRFADTPPDASREGNVYPRPQFATHQQVLAALAEERIDWLTYHVIYRDKTGGRQTRAGLTFEKATELQAKLLQEGAMQVSMDKTIACAGWPQLSYEDMKKLKELPPTPEAELKKIVDTELRRVALRVRREANEAREKELQVAEQE